MWIGLDKCVLWERVLSHIDLSKIIDDDDDDENLKVFGFYILKYYNLNFTPEIYIRFAKVASPSIFSVKCHINMSRVFSSSNKMMSNN